MRCFFHVCLAALLVAMAATGFAGDAQSPADELAARAQKNITWREQYEAPYYLDLVELEIALRETKEIPAEFQGAYYAVIGNEPNGAQFETVASYVVRTASILSPRTDHGGDLPAPKLWAGTLGGRPMMLAVQGLTDGRIHRFAVLLLKSGRAQVWEHSWVTQRGQAVDPAYFCQIGK